MSLQRQLDSRLGMTYPVFSNAVGVLSAQAISQGKLFRPELLPASFPDSQRRTRTWLTGYEASYEYDEALIGVVQPNGEPSFQQHSIKTSFATIGFRPAVVIGHSLIAEYNRNNTIDQE